MRADPTHWRRYYESTGAALDMQLQYSLSDRIRYYWPVPAVAHAVERLCATFDESSPPVSLVSQYLPGAVEPLREGRLALHASELVIHHIRGVLQQYCAACLPGES